MQLKSMMSYHYTSIKTDKIKIVIISDTGKDVEEVTRTSPVGL